MADAPEYVIPLGRRGMEPQPNRLLHQPDQLHNAVNVSVERHNVHAIGTMKVWDRLGVNQPIFPGTLTVAKVSGTVAASYPVLPGAAYDTDVVQIVTAAQGSPWQVTVTNGVAASRTCVLSIGSLGTTSLPLTGVVDSKGNTWIRTNTAPEAGPVNTIAEQWTAYITTPLVGGVDTITMTWGGGATTMALLVGAYTNFYAPPTPIASNGANLGNVTDVGLQLNYVSTVYPQFYVATVRVGSTLAASVLTSAWNDVTESIDHVDGLSLYQRAEYVVAPSLITAQHWWRSEATSALTGTVSVSVGSQVLTGVGTQFLAELTPGDQVVIAGATYTILERSTNLLATIFEPPQIAAAGAAATRIAGPQIITASSTESVGYLYKSKQQSTVTVPLNIGQLDAVTLTNTMTPTFRRGKFVEAGKEVEANLRRLFYFTGIDPIQVLAGDAATTFNITTPAADWGAATSPIKQPINGIAHRDRLWAFGNLNDPHRLYYSMVTNHNDFTGAGSGSLRVGTHVGQRLYGAANYRGVLFVWKYPRGIFYVNTTPVDVANWGVTMQSEGLGCAPSPHAVLPVDDDVLFIDPNGHLHLLSAVDTLGGVASSNLTRALSMQQWVADTIDKPGLTQMVSAYVGRNKTAYFGFRRKNSDWWQYANTVLLIVDLSLKDVGGPIRVTTATAMSPNALAVAQWDWRGEVTLLLGEFQTAYLNVPDAFGQRIESVGVAGSFSDHAVGIPITYQTPEIDLGDVSAPWRTTKKNWRTLRLIWGDGGAFTDTVTVTVHVDGDLRQTLTFRGTDRHLQQVLNCGDGYTLQCTVTTAGTSGADLQLLGLGITYAVGGRDSARPS